MELTKTEAEIIREASEVLAAVADSGVPLPANWRWPLIDELSGIAGCKNTANELAELRQKARCWDNLMHAKKATQAEPDDTGWKRAAREHGVMEAVRQCRAAHGFSLLEAKECVTAYLQNRR